MERRKALSVIVTVLMAAWSMGAAALAGLFVSTPLRRRKEGAEIFLGHLSAFSPEYRAVRVRVPVVDGWHEKVEQLIYYVRRDGAGQPEVLSSRCTHLGCTVKWDGTAGADGEFFCACHDGRFGPNGAVISGPIPKPLSRVLWEVREGRVFIKVSR